MFNKQLNSRNEYIAAKLPKECDAFGANERGDASLDIAGSVCYIEVKRGEESGKSEKADNAPTKQDNRLRRRRNAFATPHLSNARPLGGLPL